ncbi:IniB N-terminal domain-containing protein [Saccharothrix sp. S26]|uniref:IniB N-terminal domain-containing protein n=1 Tax=Saccharothrix sp. S26 TaxID=2907215 RepID=UPI001F44CE0D|nr:IniB N-terminal domain-containing protein [Saccharothrix sp. S26]MCE6994286.1 IniB N-terminal domain-containing protein [Saccharothrix sp. S26]
MGSSPNTLHDFVLDLLSDPTALADFQADAEGTLARAGLSDISALDVQEVIPLVLDYVPTGSLPALDGSLVEDLPLDLVDAGQAGAIFRLKAVTDQLAVSGATGAGDVKAAVAGTLSADASGLSLFGGVSSWDLLDGAASAELTVEGDFSAVGDVTDTLDGTLHTATGQVAGLTATATGTLDGADATAGGVTGALPDADGLTSTAFGTLDTLDSVVGNVTGGLTSSLPVGDLGNVAGLGDALGVSGSAHGSADFDTHGVAPLSDVTGAVAGVADTAGVGGVVSNVTSAVDGLDLPVVDSLGVDDLLF